LFSDGLGSGAAQRRAIEIVGHTEGNAHHGEIGVQDIEVAATGNVKK
jgi:hypothetical protein